MRKSKFTDEQIAFALRQAEGGTMVDEICRKMREQHYPYTLYRFSSNFSILANRKNGL